jgi:hypothetical protein
LLTEGEGEPPRGSALKRVLVIGGFAKLSVASKAATEQRVKGIEARGLKMRDGEMKFFFMGIFAFDV